MPRHVREERARELIALGRTLEMQALASRVGKTESVLIEELDGAGRGMGYTGGYMRAHVAGAQPGEIVTIRVTGTEDGELIGER